MASPSPGDEHGEVHSSPVDGLPVGDNDDESENEEENQQPGGMRKGKRKKDDPMDIFIASLRCRPTGQNSAKPDSRLRSANRFYLPQFAKKFRVLMRTFPTWSALMQGPFENHEDVAVSARVETSFAAIKKNLVPKGSAPRRLDKFLVGHIRMIDVIMIKAYAFLHQLEQKPKPSREMEYHDLDYLIAYDNWRNKGTAPVCDDGCGETGDQEEKFDLVDLGKRTIHDVRPWQYERVL